MMPNVQSSNDHEEKDNASSVTFQRANSLPAPCGIKTENLISAQNRGSIGTIVISSQVANESNTALKLKMRKSKFAKISKY